MSGTKTTEADILDRLDLNDGHESDVDNSTQESGEEQQQEGPDDVANAPLTDTAQPTEKPTNQATDPKPTQTQAAPTQPNVYTPAELAGAIQRRDGNVEVPNKTDSRVRDIVNPKTGEIIAFGGRERTYFETAQRAQHMLGLAQRKMQQLESSAQSSNAIVQEATKLNLSSQDSTVALNIMSRFLKDPVKVLEEMVAEVKSKGYPIPFLENGVTPGMDMAAIARMIDTRMAPLTTQQATEQQNEQVRAQAKETMDNFLDSYPEAQHNLGTLAEIMTASFERDGKHMTIQDAYVTFVKWAASQGLDYSLDVKPQIEAKFRNQQQPTNQQPINQPQTQRAPLPVNGRPQVNGQEQTTDSAVVFREDARWDDVVRHAMRQAGYSGLN